MASFTKFKLNILQKYVRHEFIETLWHILLSTQYPCYSLNNKKVIGKFKDENSGILIKDFIRLCSELYTFKADDIITKNPKGIKENVFNIQTNIELLKKCIVFYCIYEDNVPVTVHENNEELHNYRITKLFCSENFNLKQLYVINQH